MILVETYVQRCLASSSGGGGGVGGVRGSGGRLIYSFIIRSRTFLFTCRLKSLRDKRLYQNQNSPVSRARLSD